MQSEELILVSALLQEAGRLAGHNADGSGKEIKQDHVEKALKAINRIGDKLVRLKTIRECWMKPEQSD